jgi:hypothetical protein
MMLKTFFKINLYMLKTICIPAQLVLKLQARLGHEFRFVV